MKYLLVSTLFVTFLIGGFDGLSTAKAAPHDALTAMAREDWAEARQMVAAERNPVLNKLYEYLLYTDSENYTGLSFDAIAAFIKANPHWPDQDKMRKSAERNINQNITGATSAASLQNFFTAYPPLTGTGILAFANIIKRPESIMMMLEKQFAAADMDTATQDKIYRTYYQLISEDVSRRRLDSLLFNDQTSLARAYAALLGRGYPDLVEARLLLAKDKSNAEQAIARVPQSLQNDAGLLYERLRWRRRNDMDAGAIQILNLQPQAGTVSNIEEWWKERNILARRMIEKRDYKTAYALAANHGAMDGQEYAEAEWLAGWLALRFLNDPQRALSHFQAMQPRMKTPISRARAAYWSARALEAAGKKDDAVKWFQYAMNFPTAYYGQLAATHLKQNSIKLPVAVANANDRARIENSDLGQAIRMTHDAGMNGVRNKLIKALTEQAKTAGDYKALAGMLTRMRLPQEAVKVAKKAAGDNVFLGVDAYPVLQSYFKGVAIDPALAHGLIRQESQFDVGVRSPAGALGFMQLMPATAREVAQKNGWEHKTEWLATNPRHNILLGSAYLSTVLKRFDNSYPMAMAAYNAGPRRVDQWIEMFGDPRTGSVDWVDWIELIPIYETRNYVQRVTEGYLVYRDQMGVR